MTPLDHLAQSFGTTPYRFSVYVGLVSLVIVWAVGDRGHAGVGACARGRGTMSKKYTPGVYPSYRLMTDDDTRLLSYAHELLVALYAVRDWRGLDGDGISDPVRQLVIDTIAKATQPPSEGE